MPKGGGRQGEPRSGRSPERSIAPASNEEVGRLGSDPPALPAVMARRLTMRKHLFWALVLISVVFSGSAASAEAVASPAPLPGVAAPAPLPALAASGAGECQAASAAKELEVMLGVTAKGVPICHGNDCKKNSDCRPAEFPECANCWCIGPLGDKFCSCF
jgi:hypothetical protein